MRFVNEDEYGRGKARHTIPVEARGQDERQQKCPGEESDERVTCHGSGPDNDASKAAHKPDGPGRHYERPQEVNQDFKGHGNRVRV